MSLIFCFTALQFLLRPSFAVPVTSSSVTVVATNLPNSSSSDFVGFVGDPNGRGTVSLLISCILTLVLCVWSALHLNVPRQSSSGLDTFLCNFRWVLAGIYAPELVVFTAWRQWASAKLLGDLVQKLYTDGKERAGDTPASATEPAKAATSFNHKHKWTRVHDFFACTGGFAFEIENRLFNENRENDLDFLPLSCPSRLTLTARGIALLAKCGHLPDVPEGVIRDKSKANDLAKSMVLIQASWMLLQTVGRLIARLPVTLLEVNTVAHVGCVFLMYVLWWDKPLLPSEPIILRGDWVKPLCAYMYMSSEMSGTLETRKSQTWVKTIFASLDWFSKIPEVEHICLSIPQPDSNDAVNYPSAGQAESQVALIDPGPCLSGLHTLRLQKTTNTAFFERRPRVGGAKASLTAQPAVTQRRWELMHSAIDLYPVIREQYVLFTHQRVDQNVCPHKRQCTHLSPAQLVVRNVQNWPSDDLLRNISGLLVGMVLWSLNFLYGGIHAAAWNGHFPTVIEKWLWRTSAAYIGFCGGLWIILNYSALLYPPLNEFWERWMDGISSWFYLAVLGSAVFVCGLSFCLARGFILVEAFISIRSLESAAYDTPDWTQIFPHF